MMKFDALEEILEEDGIVFLTYGGFLTQPLIVGMTDALEKEVENSALSVKVAHNIFTIFIELSQNMMGYAKSKGHMPRSFDSKGLIIVGREPSDGNYYIISRNIVDTEDKVKIEARLSEIEGLDNDALRRLYRDRRKSGRDKHTKGAGIGFVEIARRCDSLEHYFTPYSDDRHYFVVKAIINPN